MQKKSSLYLRLLAASCLTLPVPAFASGYNNASEWSQIGWASSYNISINGTAQTVAPNGSGVTVGIIDTGATPQWLGNIANSISLGPCEIAGCKSAADDNGHGTFVASEIASSVPSIGMTGIANGSKILAVKVLNANGSGISTDVANGIVYAANNGAQVLNLSLGPSGTGAQQAAFYNSVASAVNYAASKGVFVVFAGGNASQALTAGSNITGFTDAAIQHMLFVGSVNAGNGLSSFSNTPGSAGFVSTSGKFYAYNGMWVMADGENLYGASNYHTAPYGYSYITQMSGTSMATPQAVASLALLESQWAILRTNGTASQLLEKTTKDLGAAGTDNTYGTGLINLTQAMQPYGTLTVLEAGNKSVPLSSITGGVILGGAFGATTNGKVGSALQATLSNYTTFDSFGRNYHVNLANLVTSVPTTSATTNSVTAPKATTSSAKFADGSSLAFGNVENNPFEITPPSGVQAPSFFMEYTNSNGSTMAAGNGFPAAASFASALWGSESPVAGQIYALGASSTISNMAQGGAFMAYGSNISKDTRMAMSFSQTATGDALMGNSSSSANAFNSGITRQLGEDLKAGVTFGVLDQQNGLLDTTYSGNALNFGNNHKSFSMGATASYALSGTQDIIFDAAVIRTNGSSSSEGFISGTSTTYARSMGVAYAERDSFTDGDNLDVTLRAPAKIMSGSASLLSSSVDDNGLPVTTTQRIGLTPGGNEVDLMFGYQAPQTDAGMSWDMTVEGRRDVDNVQGVNDAAFLARTKLAF